MYNEKNNTSKYSPKKTTLHNFHIVDASPWPLAVAFSAFFFVFGLTLYMHSFEKGLNLMFLGLIALTWNVAFWFRDIVREGSFEGQYSVDIQKGLRIGVILFIVSEIMLFFAFFWSFFHSSLNPVPEIGCVWPPVGIATMNAWGIPLLNTALLLTSGASLTWAHAALLSNDKEQTISGLLLTIILAVFFTGFQVYEYFNAPFNISDSVYGSTFYMLTGLHGFHVIVGTIFLAVALYRTVKNHFGKDIHLGFESAAWYWHFVDVVWIFLFLTVYIWGDVSN